MLVIGGIALSIRLGFWQISRYNTNKGFEDHLTAMESASTLLISGVGGSEELLNMEYRPVQASGTYDYSRQVAVRNQFWMQPWGQDIGFILLTPLLLPDGSAVIVDRGWIPLANNTTASWRQFEDTPGPAVANGIIRLTTVPEVGGVPNPTLAPGEDHLDFWNYVDLPALQKQYPYPILPFYIELAPDPSFTGMPYRALPQLNLSGSDTNAGYAGMWFIFSLLLFCGYPVYLKKQTQAQSRQEGAKK